MKKQTKTLAIALLALTCASAGVGAGVIANNFAQGSVITASAETKYTITKLGGLGHSTASVVYAYALDENEKPASREWPALTFVADSGDGFTWNGQTADVPVIKLAGADFYIELGKDAAAGDYFTLDGEFYNETDDETIVFKNCSLKYNGSAWETYTDYKDCVLGKVYVSGGNNQHVYFKPVDETVVLTVDSWTDAFSYVSGNGITVNGEMINMENSVKSPEGSFFADLGAAASEGDILKIGGVFRCATKEADYVIEDRQFKWNGSAWEVYGEEIKIETYEIGEIVVHGNSKNGTDSTNDHQLYTARADGVDLPFMAWEHPFVLEEGAGVLVNDEAVGFEMQSTDAGLFFGFAAVSAGDVVTVSGTFYCATKSTKYVIEESKFVWNGTVWAEYVESVEPEIPENPVDYEDFEAGKLVPTGASTNAGVYLKPADISITLPVNSWTDAFSYVSGNGITVNGVMIDMENSVKSPDHSFYVDLKTLAASEGDILKVGGVFRCEGQEIDYVIEDREYIWNGSAWEIYGEIIEIEVYQIGEIVVHANSKNGTGSTNDHQLYTARADGEELPLVDASWTHKFELEEGTGVLVNSEELPFEMKSTDAGLFFGFGAVEIGDVVTIGGTFVCETASMKYVIEESKFVWWGDAWAEYVEYTTYELGKLAFVSDYGEGKTNMFDFSRLDGEVIEINGERDGEVVWNTVLSCRYASGVGVTLNDVAVNAVIKVPNDFFVELPGYEPANEDVLVIGGTFYSVDLAVEYVVTETKFTYVDGAWLSDLELYKLECQNALDEYVADNFAESDYYAAEWNFILSTLEETKEAISAANSKEEVDAILDAAEEAFEGVMTKAESDAIFAEKQSEAKAELAAYKNASDYREAEVAALQEILTNANTAIDGCVSVQDINNAVTAAKEAMDALKTGAQWTADEAVVSAAKAELAGYKAESDYKAEQWAEIQAIITEANADIDEAIGDETAISAIVAAAKTEIDAVKTGATVDAEALVVAKESANAEIQSYYNSIDRSLYSEEGKTQINGFVKAAKDAVEAATTVAEVDAAIATLKTSVEGVEKVSSGTQDTTSFGCGASVSGIAAGMTMLMAAGVALLGKKKED